MGWPRQEVREVGNRDPFVCLEPVLPPPFSEVAAVSTDHFDGRHVGVPHVEAGRQDQGVDEPFGAVAGDDAAGSIRSMPVVSRCTCGLVSARK